MTEKPYRTLWPGADGASVEIIDQTRLPHEFAIVRLATVEDAARAIKDMLVRGAPLIGATAAYGLWLALRQDATDQALRSATTLLLGTRPTAVNLRWALETVHAAVFPLDPPYRGAVARALAARICDDDVAVNRALGQAGLPLIRAAAARKPPGSPVNILTHCNAGWLATVDIGHGHRPDLRGAGGRFAHPRLG